jgi:hypothetical protein
MRRQCALLGLNRATAYDHAAPEDPLKLELMRNIDEQSWKPPFYGWPRMTAALRAPARPSLGNGCGG